jgi:hypothetical protein
MLLDSFARLFEEESAQAALRVVLAAWAVLFVQAVCVVVPSEATDLV